MQHNDLFTRLRESDPLWMSASSLRLVGLFFVCLAVPLASSVASRCGVRLYSVCLSECVFISLPLYSSVLFLNMSAVSSRASQGITKLLV